MALLNVNFFSDVLGMWMQMDVILPQQRQNQNAVDGD
jgi:putative tributyrin esterase